MSTHRDDAAPASVRSGPPPPFAPGNPPPAPGTLSGAPNRAISLREALPLAVAAALHAAAVWGRGRGWAMGFGAAIAGAEWSMPALFLATALAVSWTRRREVAVWVALAVLPFIVSPGVFALLLAAAAGVWGCSRLRLGVASRLGLSAGVLATAVGVRCGWMGPWLATAVRIGAGPELLLWSMLLYRAWLLQAERDALQPSQRSFQAFLGVVGLVALCGTVISPPIPHATLYAERRRGTGAGLAWRGVGLLAMALAYQLLAAKIVPLAEAPLRALRQTPGSVPLEAALAAHTPGRLWLALLLYWPFRYVAIAARLFFLIGNLRLLGFDLEPGFRRPFLARNFVELWRRWNHYVRDAAMILFYFPMLGVLRRRVPVAWATALAVVTSFLALAFVNTVVWPAFQLPLVIERGAPSVQFGRILVTGLITATTAWVLVGRKRNRSAPPVRRVVGVAATVLAAGAISTLAVLLSLGIRGHQLVQILTFLVTTR